MYSDFTLATVSMDIPYLVVIKLEKSSEGSIANRYDNKQFSILFCYP